MKFYVAGKFEEAERVRRVVDALTDMGHEVTHDWTRVDQSRQTPEAFAEYALDDFTGALLAEVLIILADHPDIYGALIEAGITLGAGGEVWAVNPLRSQHIFWTLPNVWVFDNINDVLIAALPRRFSVVRTLREAVRDAEVR
jgi:hypothetical protein